MVKDTQSNGFVLKISDKEWWPLEYTWNTVTPDEAWYVINGSLFGMRCVEMLYLATGDERLYELYDKSKKGYMRKANEFYYPDDMWCWYSLNSSEKIRR